MGSGREKRSRDRAGRAGSAVLEKVNGSIVNVGINPSKVAITKLRLNKDRKSLLDRKVKGRAAANKHKGTKFTAEDAERQLIFSWCSPPDHVLPCCGLVVEVDRAWARL
ncbi:hypothetical protein M0R45_035987 [Rubus argutus]|uniref:Uncharacterized protein n=1 Tax=Rubus argutus TaxID=59490 RepID=A0AAW1VZF7_RUBAR